MKPKKSKVIAEIIKECRADGSKVFDHLNEQTEQYLNKILTVIRAIQA